jgi:hypothetical protein
MLRTRRSLYVELTAYCFAVLAAAHPAGALADAPCADTDREVESIAKVMQRHNGEIAKDAAFRVKRIGEYGEGSTGLPSFEVSYEVRGRVLFHEKIAHPSPAIADSLIIKPLRTADGAKLGVSYLMGAGGRVGCEYKLYDKGGQFVVKRGKW